MECLQWNRPLTFYNYCCDYGATRHLNPTKSHDSRRLTVDLSTYYRSLLSPVHRPILFFYTCHSRGGVEKEEPTRSAYLSTTSSLWSAESDFLISSGSGGVPQAKYEYESWSESSSRADWKHGKVYICIMATSALKVRSSWVGGSGGGWVGLGWFGTDYSGAADRLQYTNYMICTRVKGSCATLNPSLKK